MTINTSTSFVEQKLSSPRRSISNFDAPPYSRLWQFRHDTDTDTPSHKSVHFRHHTTGCDHVCIKGKRRYSALFVERKSTLPRRGASNFDIDSTSHDWDREAVYENQRCSSWLEHYLLYISSTRYRQWQQRSRYNRTVCHLRRSGWLEVKTVEADSTIDYRV